MNIPTRQNINHFEEMYNNAGSVILGGICFASVLYIGLIALSILVGN